MGEFAFAPRRLPDLYHLLEGILSFARRDCVICPKQYMYFIANYVSIQNNNFLVFALGFP